MLVRIECDGLTKLSLNTVHTPYMSAVAALLLFNIHLKAELFQEPPRTTTCSLSTLLPKYLSCVINSNQELLTMSLNQVIFLKLKSPKELFKNNIFLGLVTSRGKWGEKKVSK